MHRECPQEFQDRINAVTGTNQYGDPIFRLAWGQTETMRAGGTWAKDGFRGYRDILVGSNSPCWMIMMWEGPEVYRSPEYWYMTHRDEATGLQDLGEYPYHGRYRLIHKLIHYYRDHNGHVKFEAMDLSTMIIDAILPMVKAWQSLSKEAQVTALRYEQDLRDQEAASALAEQKASYAPAFKGAVSFTRQGCRTSLIAKKEAFLEKHWRELMGAAAQFKKGFQQA